MPSRHKRFPMLITSQKGHVLRCIFLSALPEAKTNMVQLEIFWWSLLSEPKVSTSQVSVSPVHDTCTCTCRFVHGFTCAGVLPSQYINLSRFAGIGNVGHKYIKQGLYSNFLKML